MKTEKEAAGRPVSNYVYTDGHARNGHWNQLYWQRGEARTGIFDPRNEC